MSCRIIREHRVYGKAVTVEAANEAEARAKASVGGFHCWEAKAVSTGSWECYVAKHEDCFALND